MVGIIILILLAALLLFIILAYNSLVKLRVQCENAWADIEVQLKRRYDLVPNLVETVKGYAAHERATFEKVTETRSRAMSATGPAAKAQAEDMFTQVLRTLFAVAENYPQLRAVESFTQLQSELTQIEEQVQFARRYYNAVVRDLNTRIAQFPTNLIAGIFGFRAREFFEVTAAVEREAPKVRFETPSA